MVMAGIHCVFERSVFMSFVLYKRKGLSEMRSYVLGEDLSGVSISEPDKAAGSPKEGDMIARNPKNHADQWLVAKKYFEDNLEPANSFPNGFRD
jgi:hypothetical protein